MRYYIKSPRRLRRRIAFGTPQLLAKLCDLCELCGYSHLKTLNSQLPHSPKIFRMNSQNTETKIKHIKFTIKLQLSYTPARAWPHRFHVRLMADPFVFNHVEQAEHIAMPHYLSLHDLHGLSNLNQTKYHSEGPQTSCPQISIAKGVA